jgi:hypothetical protein
LRKPNSYLHAKCTSKMTKISNARSFNKFMMPLLKVTLESLTHGA